MPRRWHLHRFLLYSTYIWFWLYAHTTHPRLYLPAIILPVDATATSPTCRAHSARTLHCTDGSAGSFPPLPGETHKTPAHYCCAPPAPCHYHWHYFRVTAPCNNETAHALPLLLRLLLRTTLYNVNLGISMIVLLPTDADWLGRRPPRYYHHSTAYPLLYSFSLYTAYLLSCLPIGRYAHRTGRRRKEEGQHMRGAGGMAYRGGRQAATNCESGIAAA